MANLEELLQKLTEKVDRLEIRGEIYAPFPWVHDLINPLRDSIANIRETVASLPVKDEHLAHVMNEVKERVEALEDLLGKTEERLETMIEGLPSVAALAQDNAALRDEVKADMTALKTDIEQLKTLIKQTTTLSRVEKVARWCGALTAIAGTCGASVVAYIKWIAPILHAVSQAIGDVIKNGIK